MVTSHWGLVALPGTPRPATDAEMPCLRSELTGSEFSIPRGLGELPRPIPTERLRRLPPHLARSPAPAVPLKTHTHNPASETRRYTYILCVSYREGVVSPRRNVKRLAHGSLAGARCSNFSNTVAISSSASRGRIIYGEKAIKVDNIYRHVYATPLKCPKSSRFLSQVCC